MNGNELDGARRWLIQAEDELEDARLLLEAKRYYLTLYLSQQSAEKALKAFLFSQGVKPILTHSVSDLLNLSAEIDPSFEKLKPSGRLDDYYIPTRYPNGLPGGIPSRYYQNADEAQRAIVLSEKVIEKVRNVIDR